MRLWIFLLLSACSAPAPIAVPPTPTGWIDDQAFPISKAWVFSEDNENVRWSVVLASMRGFPEEFRGDLQSAHVDFAGESRAVRGIGGSPSVVYFTFEADRAGAAQCAKGLGVQAHARVDPRLTLSCRLEPVDPAPAGHSQRIARFVMQNAGQRPFTFLSHGIGQSSERDSHFQVTIDRNGIRLPEVASPMDLGGPRQQVTLEPGGSHSFELDLAAWASFDEPGLYRIHAQVRLEIEAPYDRKGDPYDYAHLRWEAASAAECELRID